MTGTVTVSVLCDAQASVEIHKNLPMPSAEPVVLSVETSREEVEILYNRDGQVSITAAAQVTNDSRLDENYFPTTLAIEQSGNPVVVRFAGTRRAWKTSNRERSIQRRKLPLSFLQRNEILIGVLP
jgi:hypothetical protein